MAEDPMRNIIDYLKKNMKKGYTLDSLKFALIGQGYSRIAIEEAMKRVTRELAEKAPILKHKPTISYEVVDENGQPVNIKKPFWKK